MQEAERGEGRASGGDGGDGGVGEGGGGRAVAGAAETSALELPEVWGSTVLMTHAMTSTCHASISNRAMIAAAVAAGAAAAAARRNAEMEGYGDGDGDARGGCPFQSDGRQRHTFDGVLWTRVTRGWGGCGKRGDGRGGGGGCGGRRETPRSKAGTLNGDTGVRSCRFLPQLSRGWRIGVDSPTGIVTSTTHVARQGEANFDDEGTGCSGDCGDGGHGGDVDGACTQVALLTVEDCLIAPADGEAGGGRGRAAGGSGSGSGGDKGIGEVCLPAFGPCNISASSARWSRGHALSYISHFFLCLSRQSFPDVEDGEVPKLTPRDEGLDTVVSLARALHGVSRAFGRKDSCSEVLQKNILSRRNSHHSD